MVRFAAAVCRNVTAIALLGLTSEVENRRTLIRIYKDDPLATRCDCRRLSASALRSGLAPHLTRLILLNRALSSAILVGVTARVTTIINVASTATSGGAGPFQIGAAFRANSELSSRRSFSRRSLSRRQSERDLLSRFGWSVQPSASCENTGIRLPAEGTRLHTFPISKRTGRITSMARERLAGGPCRPARPHVPRSRRANDYGV